MKKHLKFFTLLSILLLPGCKQGKDVTDNSCTCQIFWLENSQGTRLKVTDFGARVMEFWVKDRDGVLTDIVLGYDSAEAYFDSPEPYFGAAIGRYGNRIAQAEFKLDGKIYKLAKNNGQNSLHGGPNGFHNVCWEVLSAEDTKIVFNHLSPDGEEGFPGNLQVKMVYELTENNEFVISYEASADKSTVLNLTHHSFFNLNGAGESDVQNHILFLNASHFIPVDEGLIPLGELAAVQDSPFDFTSPKSIGRDINQDHEQIKFGGGFDHNWVLDRTEEGQLELVARIHSPKTGIEMEVFTTEPGIQFYSGNFLDGSIRGKQDKPYGFRTAFCLETQHFPDSPNHPQFPETVLKPGDTYRHTCIYKIGILK